jgi:Ca-activated chloride channel family protein
MASSGSYYAVLGVSPQATQTEILAAFNRQLARFPKDTRDPIANLDFRKLIVSYQVLSDLERRAVYDRSLGTRASGEPQPLKIQLFASQTTLRALPGEDQLLYLLIDISANPSLMWSAPSLNLCLVVDRSTSMKGPRISQVKEAARLIVEKLAERDAFSLVTFSDHADVVVPAGPVTNPGLVRSKISQISTGGATEILQGLSQAMVEMSRAKSVSELNHLILLTDGHTYGDESECVDLAREAAAAGIGISAFGIGHKWNDAFLDALVAPSGSSAVYLESPEQIVGYLKEYIQALNRTFAKEISLWLELPTKISARAVHRLSPSPAPIPYSNRLMALGSLQFNVPISVLAELIVQPHLPDRSARLQVGVSARVISHREDVERFHDQLEIKFVTDPPQTMMLPALVRAVRRLNLHRMSEKAWQEAEGGEIEQASRRMERLGSQLLEAGQAALAATAFREAENIARTGCLSPEGRKQLKYGTRTLIGS